MQAINNLLKQIKLDNSSNISLSKQDYDILCKHIHELNCRTMNERWEHLEDTQLKVFDKIITCKQLNKQK